MVVDVSLFSLLIKLTYLLVFVLDVYGMLNSVYLVDELDICIGLRGEIILQTGELRIKIW